MVGAVRPRAWRLLSTLVVAALSCGDGTPHPRVIRVAAVQLRAVPGTLGDNVAKATGLIREAAARGARYIVLPELYGFFVGPENGRDLLRESAESLDGPVTTMMLALARELDVNIAFGLPERRGNELYNSVVLVGPGGIAGVYSKRVLVTVGAPGAREVDVFSPGKGPGVVSWGGVRTGVLICADAGFDKLWQDTVVQGVQLVVVPTAGPSWLFPGQPTFGETAHKHGAPAVRANHWRPAENLMGYGESQIVDATGAVLANAERTPDSVIVADVPLGSGRTGTAGGS